jgi:phosphoglycolate phosphatase-like HAD superfamily hydrolase
VLDRKSFIESVCSLAKNSSHTVWCTDFDGTLSEYVPYQDEAVPMEGAIGALTSLQQAGLEVVIVSGRPVSYLRRMLGDEFPLYGSYGTETFRKEYSITPIAQRAKPNVEKFTQLILEFLDEQGARYEFSARVAHDSGAFFVEEKPISVSLNMQAGDHQRKLRRYVDEMFLALDPSPYGLTMEDYGVQILIHPIDFPLYTNKSSVVNQLKDSSRIIFCGDDASDIEAAAATKSANGLVLVVDNQLPPPRLPTPDALIEIADYVVRPNGNENSQAELIALIDDVARALIDH